MKSRPNSRATCRPRGSIIRAGFRGSRGACRAYAWTCAASSYRSRTGPSRAHPGRADDAPARDLTSGRTAARAHPGRADDAPARDLTSGRTAACGRSERTAGPARGLDRSRSRCRDESRALRSARKGPALQSGRALRERRHSAGVRPILAGRTSLSALSPRSHRRVPPSMVGVLVSALARGTGRTCGAAAPLAGRCATWLIRPRCRASVLLDVRELPESRQRARADEAVLQHVSGVDLAAPALRDGGPARERRRSRHGERRARANRRAERGADRTIRRGDVEQAGMEQRGVDGVGAPARRSDGRRAGGTSALGSRDASRGRAARRRHLVRGRELSPLRASGALVRCDARRDRRHRDRRAAEGAIRGWIRGPVRDGTSRLHIAVAQGFAVRHFDAPAPVRGTVRARARALKRRAADRRARRALRGWHFARRYWPFDVDRRRRTESPGHEAPPRGPRLAIAAARTDDAPAARTEGAAIGSSHRTGDLRLSARWRRGVRRARLGAVWRRPRTSRPAEPALHAGCHALARRSRHRIVRGSVAVLVPEHARAQRADDRCALTGANRRVAAVARRAR